jgi:hypothetical protein
MSYILPTFYRSQCPKPSSSQAPARISSSSTPGAAEVSTGGEGVVEEGTDLVADTASCVIITPKADGVRWVMGGRSGRSGRRPSPPAPGSTSSHALTVRCSSAAGSCSHFDHGRLGPVPTSAFFAGRSAVPAAGQPCANDLGNFARRADVLARGLTRETMTIRCYAM